MPNRRLADRVALRMAALRRRKAWNHSRRIAMVVLGAALSIGGVSEAFDSVHFVVRKDLDAVRVVRQNGHHNEVVARLGDGFAANSLFKLARALPDRYVSHELGLFDSRWIPAATGHAVGTELTLLNNAIRQQFFSNAVPFGDLIHEKSQKYDVDPVLVAAVMETESRFHTRARSQVGAMGLMQLMPRTGRWLGAKNLYDPDQNIEAGTKYLSYLSKRFDGNLKNTIAAYNAGEGTVQRYGGVPPYQETRIYVTRVLSRYHQRHAELKAYQKPAEEQPAEIVASR
jgi:soluble lytic murein transglycosylase-like protein